MFSNPLFKYTEDVLKNSIFLSCSNSHNFHLTSHKSHKFNTFVHAIWFAGCTVVPLLRLSHHNKKPFCVAFACSPCDYTVSPGTPASSHSPKTHTANVFASRCVHKCVCEWMFVFLHVCTNDLSRTFAPGWFMQAPTPSCDLECGIKQC